MFVPSGHAEHKPVTSMVGSVTEPAVMRKACKGVSSVYHIAGLISYGTFPDYSAMQRVNVQGTISLTVSLQTDTIGIGLFSQ